MYEENRVFDNQTQTEPARQPQVFESILTLEKSADVVLKSLEELESRLAPVLRTEPQAAGNAPKDAATAVPIAARLNEITQRVHSIGAKIGSINRRLEV